MADSAFICPKCGEQFPVPTEESEWAKPCPKCGISVLPPAGPRRSAPLKITNFNPPQAPSATVPRPVSAPSVPARKQVRLVCELAVWVSLILAGGGALVWWLNREQKPLVAPAVSETAISAPTNAAGTKPEMLPVPPPPPATVVITAEAPATVVAKTPDWMPVELSNPGFENGLKGWRVTPKAGPVQALTEAAHSGKRGVRLTDGSDTGSSDLMSQRFPAEARGEYEVRCWARYVSGDGAGLYLRFYDAKGKGLNSQTLNNEIKVVIPKQATVWKEVNVSGTAPKGAATGEIWLHTMKSAAVTVDVDDFRLRRQQ